jgi:hypothetical protein
MVARGGQFAAIIVCMMCAAGCAGFSRSENVERAARVLVRNNSWTEVNVYIAPAGTRQARTKVAWVMGMTREMISLSLDTGLTQYGFYLIVAPIGGREQFVTEMISLKQNEVLVLNVEDNLAFSNWHVR